MAIQVRCPWCGLLVKAPDGAAGKMGKCPKCQEKFKILARPPAIDWAQEPAESAATEPPPPVPLEAVKKPEALGLISLCLPLCVGLGAFFFLRSSEQFTGLCLVTVLITSILISMEAKALGVGNEYDRTPKGKIWFGKNVSGPGQWFLASILLWIVVFPSWMYHRSKYGMRNLCGWAILSALIFVGTGLGLRYSTMTTTNIQNEIHQIIQETLRDIRFIFISH